MRGTRTRLTVAMCVGAATALAAAGCGSSNSSSSSSTSSSGGSNTTGGANAASLTATPGINEPVSKSIAAQVPSDVKSSGTLSVAADATYPPDEFIKGSAVIGADADLAKAIAQEMGLTPDVKNVTFDSIIPGLAANKYDLGMSSFTVTKEREKTVDFVTYLSAGTSFYVKADGGPDIQSLADLCGENVAVERGTTQQSDALAQDKKCKAAGKSGVSVQVLPDQNQANLAISSGRADVGMADSPPAAYIVAQSNGQFKLSGKPYGAAPYGIAMPKNSGLTKPVLAAVKELMADGAYKKILDYWGLQQGAITNPEINPTNVPAA